MKDTNENNESGWFEFLEPWQRKLNFRSQKFKIKICLTTLEIDLIFNF
jgi:hypothetical protein